MHGMRDITSTIIGMISQLAISFDVLDREYAILWYDLRDSSTSITIGGKRTVTRKVDPASRSELLMWNDTLNIYSPCTSFTFISELRDDTHVYLDPGVKLKLRYSNGTIENMSQASTVRIINGQMMWLHPDGRIGNY